MYTAVSVIWIGERISNEYYFPDLSPMTLHDIAVVFSIDAFMELKFLLDIMLKFPMRGEEPSNYDELVEWTKAQMKNYHTILASAMAII